MDIVVDSGMRRECPLLFGVSKAVAAIRRFKVHVREYFYEVALFGLSCSSCGGALKMRGEGVCSCADGHRFDPTEAFQRSQCCAEGLVKRRFHYECEHCGDFNKSRFLFEERVFDADYFRERMQEARRQKRARKERVRLMLGDSRSDPIVFDGIPDLDAIPGLLGALNDFIEDAPVSESAFGLDDRFDLPRYREVILSFLGGVSASFDAFPPLSTDVRTDRARRFVTLIYLEHEREVRLSQYGDNILVEAYAAD